MVAITGHAAEILNATLDAAVRKAISEAECKLLISEPSGNHREVIIGNCDGVARFEATHCHMHLERRRPELKNSHVPAALSGFPVDRVNAYISPSGKGATLHFDSRTSLIVQLVGSKLWELSPERAVASPGINCVAPPGVKWVQYSGRAVEVPSTLVPYQLRPGDWLIVPKGTWHRTKTISGSVSLTLAMPD
jgi:hypothetical protein